MKPEQAHKAFQHANSSSPLKSTPSPEQEYSHNKNHGQTTKHNPRPHFPMNKPHYDRQASRSPENGGSVSPLHYRSTTQVKNTEVTFSFTCKNTSFGDKVAMVGSMPLLGHWDPLKAVDLLTSDKTYPVWTIKIDLPRDRVIEYKYLLIKAPLK